jgi:hypothetical protein
LGEKLTEMTEQVIGTHTEVTEQVIGTHVKRSWAKSSQK